MTENQTLKIMQIVSATYPRFFVNQTKEEKVMALKAWHVMLRDLDYNLCQAAVYKLASTSPYPPNVSDIRKNAVDVIEGIQENPLDLWNEAFKLISKSSRITEEEFNNINPILKRYFNNLSNLKDHGKMDLDIVNSVTKGQFLKQIKVTIEHDRESKQLPKGLKNMLGNIGKPMIGE